MDNFYSFAVVKVMLPKRIEKFYLFGIKSIVFLIPVLPFYVSQSMVFPYVTGKNFAFRILVELAAVLWVGLITFNKEYCPKNSTMLLVVLAFVFVVGLSDLFGINSYNSFWSNYERMDGYITILHLTFYFLIIRSIFKTKRDWIIFLNIFVITGFLVSLYALLQELNVLPLAKHYEAGVPRVYSTIGSPPLLASYLLFIVFIGVILVVNTQKVYLGYCYVFFIIVNAIAIYYTRTRGAFLSVIGGSIFLGLLYAVRRTKTKREQFVKRNLLIVVGLFIILLAFFWPVREADVQKNRPFSRFVSMLNDPSAQSRLKTWQAAWKGIKERPILGWGQENFTSIYTVIPVPSPFSRFFPFTFSEPLWTDRAHNIILEWLINAGGIGISLYFGIFYLAFRNTRRAIRKNFITEANGVTIIVALFVYFTQNLFIFDTINTYIIFFTLLSYIDNFTYTDKEMSFVVSINSLKIKQHIVITLFTVIVFSFINYYINYKPIKEAQISNQISNYYPEHSSFITLLGGIKKALSFKTFGDTDVRIRMAIIADNILKYKLFHDKGALMFLQFATEELRKLVILNPHNLSYRLYLIDIYNSISFYEPSFVYKTENLIKNFIQFSPKNQWMVYFYQADNFVLKKDYENALLTIKKAVELAPQKDTVQLRLALAGILTSREDIVDIALNNVRKIRKTKNPEITKGLVSLLLIDELQLLAQTSMEVKNFKRSIGFYKEILSISPNEAKYHFDIAKIYFLMGDEINTKKEAEKSVEIDPLAYSEDAKKLIDSLKK